MPNRYTLLTPQTAGQFVRDLSSLKRDAQGEKGVLSFEARGSDLSFAAKMECGYDSRAQGVRCVFDNSASTFTVFPVASPAIAARGRVCLDGGTPPSGIGKGERETRWQVGDLEVYVYTSRVILAGGRLRIWSDWRIFRPGLTWGPGWGRWLCAQPFDTKLFGPLCPRAVD